MTRVCDPSRKAAGSGPGRWHLMLAMDAETCVQGRPLVSVQVRTGLKSIYLKPPLLEVSFRKETWGGGGAGGKGYSKEVGKAVC